MITKLLGSLDLLAEITTLSISTFPTFAPSTEPFFTECVSKLPPGQCIEVLELLHSHLIRSCDKIVRLEAGKRLDSLLPPLERAVDILSLVLSHLPVGFWSSKLKDKASQLLQNLISDVLQLLTASQIHVSCVVSVCVCVCV